MDNCIKRKQLNIPNIRSLTVYKKVISNFTLSIKTHFKYKDKNKLKVKKLKKIQQKLCMRKIY